MCANMQMIVSTPEMIKHKNREIIDEFQNKIHLKIRLFFHPIKHRFSTAKTTFCAILWDSNHFPCIHWRIVASRVRCTFDSMKLCRNLFAVSLVPNHE